MEALLITLGALVYLGVGAYVAEPVTKIGEYVFTCNGRFDRDRNQPYQIFIMIMWPYILVYRFTHI